MIEYSFDNGLRLRDEHIGPDGKEISTTTIVVDRDELILDSGDPDDGSDLERIHNEIHDPSIQEVEVNGKKVNVEYTTLNRFVPTSKVMAMFVGWGGSFQNPVGEREYAAIARAFPDTHILAINFPGSEGSDNLPDEIARLMSASGSFLPLAQVLTPVVESVFENYEHRTVAGSSIGARAAIAVAAGLKNGIEVLRVSEPVGTRDLGYFGIMSAFMVKEGAHAGKYRAKSPDEESAEVQRLNDTLGEMARAQRRAHHRGAWRNLMMRLPRAMSRDSLEIDLLVAEKNVREEITVINAEQTKLNDVSRTRQILGRLARIRAERGATGMVRHRTIEAKSHSYLIGTPVAQAKALQT